jgi:peptide/nickel transport system permease protein
MNSATFELWHRFRGNSLALAGFVTVILLFGIALAAPLLTPYGPTVIDAYHVLLPPSASHWFGTDELGRDVLTRMLYGARISLLVGFVAAGIAALIGTLVGLLAGYRGGWLDPLLMRFVDIMLCFPTIFLILAVIAFLGRSIWLIMAIIGFTSWMGIARLVRAEVLSLREREFVLAARAIGASPLRIMLRHILPNALAPVLVAATLEVAGAILVESSLSFLGLGVQPPTASWGNMLSTGKDYIEFAWWLSLFPGSAILGTVLAYNLVGEGVRDAVDPRLRHET